MRKYPWLTAVTVLAFSLAAHAQGAGEISFVPLAPAPDVEVQVTTPVGAPIHTAREDGIPHAFSASIRIPANGLQVHADLYFGVMRPGGKGSITWINVAGVPTLQREMAPLLEWIDLGTEGTITTTEIFGRDVEHVFTGSEPGGMYLVFALLVATGADPYNTGNWLGVDMTPLFVE